MVLLVGVQTVTTRLVQTATKGKTQGCVLPFPILRERFANPYIRCDVLVKMAVLEGLGAAPIDVNASICSLEKSPFCLWSQGDDVDLSPAAGCVLPRPPASIRSGLGVDVGIVSGRVLVRMLTGPKCVDALVHKTGEAHVVLCPEKTGWYGRHVSYNSFP